MTVTLTPSKASGKVMAPPSKSVAHRALICGAFTKKSIIKNVAMSKDVEATLSCLKTLGATVDFVNNCDLKIGGLDVFNIPDGSVIDCFESGSTLRFLIPLCLISGKKVTFVGSHRLFERPLSVYEQIARDNGFLFQKTQNSLTVCGKLTPGNYKIQGDVSSQFITGLMLALSCLEGTSAIEVTGKFESASYVDITTAVMAEFGVKITKNSNLFTISACEYKNREYVVEGDYSNAAFLDAFNLVGGNVEVLGLNPDTNQGDSVYKEFFASLKNGKKDFDLSNCPDLAPIMFAVSSVFGGAKFSGTKRLKIKESDRATAMANELGKFGVKTEISENSVEILADKLTPPAVALCGHNDHRIVMSIAVLCSITGGTINGAEAVAKSFPDFFEKIKTLGIGITQNETQQI